MDQLSNQAKLKQSLDQFQHVMAMQQEATQIAQKRISFIYRIVLIGFFLIMMGYAGTAFIMTSQMHRGTDSLKFMNTSMSNMVNQMHRMNQTMQAMNQDMKAMESMVKKINVMTDQMQQMSGSMQAMRDEMHAMDKEVLQVRKGMQTMNQEFYEMQASVVRMDREVDKLSKPARIMNKMNPFR